MTGKKTIGLVGTGLIGSGWGARCLARGHDLVVYDPGSSAEKVFSSNLENAWVALERLGFDRNTAGSWNFVDDLEELCSISDFIQESTPENIELKRRIHFDMDRYAPPTVIIASSSSGLLPSEIQEGTQNPERIVIGHPFNPVYLLPLVEIVKGSNTSEETALSAKEFYLSIGMYPLMVKKEIEGYISDRLQEAVWREALHLIADGVASTKDIDDAIVYGPGLRWAIMGVCLTFHLAGGQDGMRHMLEQFGPALELPWTHMKAPELTDKLIDRMVDGTQSQAENQSVQELEQLRDNCLIEILQVLKKYDYSAGQVNTGPI